MPVNALALLLRLATSPVYRMPRNAGSRDGLAKGSYQVARSQLLMTAMSAAADRGIGSPDCQLSNSRAWKRAGKRRPLSAKPVLAAKALERYRVVGAVMPDDISIDVSLADLREVAGYAAACARPAVTIFESQRPGDLRSRVAVDAAQAFASGGERTKGLRDAAWAAQRAAHEARDAGLSAASEAARAALGAAGAAFLHPLARAPQVKHILGAAAHAAHAFELSATDAMSVGGEPLEFFRKLASASVIDVLRRYPRAPSGGGRVGELIRQLDASLR